MSELQNMLVKIIQLFTALNGELTTWWICFVKNRSIFTANKGDERFPGSQFNL